MLIRICLAVMLLTGNASWLVAQQNLGTANLAPPQWEVPMPLAWGQVDPKMCVLDSRYRHQCNHFVSNHSTPFILQYEWKLNRDEAGASAIPSNRETWTEFATVLKPKLPTGIKRTDESSSESSSFGIYSRPYTNRVQNLSNAVLASRYPIQQHGNYSVYYQLTREPNGLHPHYEGTINSYPVITARAKTIEALEARLLEMYCDYITQMVEEDTLQAITNAKANNPLRHVPPGWWDLPEAYRFVD
jgi:hypothetical protein